MREGEGDDLCRVRGIGHHLLIAGHCSVEAHLTNRISDLCLAESTRDPSFLWQRKLMPGGACEATAFGTYGYQSTCLCLPLGNYHNMADIDGVAAGDRPARVAREEIAMADVHGMVRMLELVASRLDDDQGKIRTLLDGLHKDRSFGLGG